MQRDPRKLTKLDAVRTSGTARSSEGVGHKLGLCSLDRLRYLADGRARFYQVSAYMRRLEALDLIVATGRVDPRTHHVEYRITLGGQAELAERRYLTTCEGPDGAEHGDR